MFSPPMKKAGKDPGLVAKMHLAMINKIGNDRLESLSTGDFLVINALYHDNAIPQNLRSRLKKLNDLGIIEHIGRNKFILSRNLYSVAGKSGVHTRKRGLDRETNKELIVKHIISYPASPRRLAPCMGAC